ncbi:MAG: DUF3617 domain-containing protein [Proteobacteria bacterium]|nr:DUF3617 domain-containing protein [Pseudomonadota bacterium]
MPNMHYRWFAAALALVSMTTFAADSPKLDVRLGLWETTTTVSHNGTPGMPDMAAAAAMPPGASQRMAEAMQSMSPEQRAQMAAAMSRMNQNRGGPHEHKYKSCMTADKMRRDGFFNDKDMRGHCTHTVIENTAHSTVVSFECAEEGATSKGTVRFTAISDTQVKGTMDMNMVVHDMPMSVHTDIQSTWLGPDCGDEK